jgi:eukaryotic-like serine/threonine-protein kinase
VQSAEDRAPLSVGDGKYVVFDRIAAGGMGSVHIGRMRGPGGFGRVVAIKRLHPHLALERDFRQAFVDEARTASRVQHANVAQMLDVVVEGDEVFLVMEFVHGAVLSGLLLPRIKRGDRIPLRVSLGIMSQVLQGLHAAHTAVDESGAPLHIIHRDVSPQNVLVGADGIARVIDFGVAKANGRLVTTEDGAVKGKIAYMAPEYVAGRDVSGSADVFSAAVVLWELLAGKRMYESQEERQVVFMVVHGAVRRLGKVAPDVPPEVEAVVTKGLALRPEDRYATALEMAMAIEATGQCATTMEIGQWVRAASDTLSAQRALVARIETTPREASNVAAPAPEHEPTPLLLPVAFAENTEAVTPPRRRWLGATLGVMALLALGTAGSLAWIRMHNARSTTTSTAQSATTTAPPAETVPVAAATPVACAVVPVSAPPTARGGVVRGGHAGRVAPHPPTTARPATTGDGLFPRN